MITAKPPSLALIGCGPSGMFFLHALAVRRAKLEREGNADALAALPVVTCFERSSGPGGVWRSDRFKGAKGAAVATNMYEALWTNGPKEAMEFFDHTYQEHFGSALPVYLPRAMVLEYILARCTKHNPEFFRDVKFNTSVASVTHDAASDKFAIRLADGTEGSFDLCIWAAGINGIPYIPAALAAKFAEGGFKGATMHSSQTDATFDQHVSGKKVLIIGDAFSAEDLALTAIKLGVDSIDIVARTGKGAASNTGSWPMDKVNIHAKYAPTGVTSDGRGIVLSKSTYDGDTEKYVIESEGQVTLGCIDTIIYCTGYATNTQMLDDSLTPRTDAKGCCVFEDNEFPDSWKMSENPLSKEIGDIPLDDVYLSAPYDLVHPDVYRGRLIRNPSMFYMFESGDSPLFEIDIYAWRTLAQVVGDLPLLPPEDAHRHNIDTLLHYLNDPLFRSEFGSSEYSEAYSRQIDLISEGAGTSWVEKRWCSHQGADAAPQDNAEEDKYYQQYVSLQRIHYETYYRYVAREALASGYPVELGTFDKLNERGQGLVTCLMANEFHHYKIDEKSPDASWRTFRDGDPSQCISTFTGTRAVPLKSHWLDLDSCEKVADIVNLGGAERQEPRTHLGNVPGLQKGAALPLEGKPGPQISVLRVSIEARDDGDAEEKKADDRGDGQEVC